MDYYKRYHHSNYDSHKYKRQDSRKHYHYKRSHLNYEGDYTGYNKKSIDQHKQTNLRHIPTHNYNSHHYHSGQKRNKMERSRDASRRSSKSSKYHNKYNHRIHPKNKSTLNSYKSKSNYSSNNKSSSGLSSKHKMDQDHYKYTIGEIVGERFKLISFISDGTFGRVLDCVDILSSSRQKYAIKIIRPVERYIESAEIEANIIEDINNKDSQNESYCIKMIDSFYFRKEGYGYYAIIFEKLGLSLFDFIKLNNYRGFPVRHIQKIAYQILKGIGYLHKNGIIHTDLKPENILLVNSGYVDLKDKNLWPINVLHKEDKLNNYSPSTRSYSKEKEDCYNFLHYTDIKIIDFGGAIYSRQDHSGTINTRQYRSPEVIMDCFEWDEKSDVWSIACILCELYTGELLFATHDNAEHLSLIEKVCGEFPHEMTTPCCKELKSLFVPKDREKGIVMEIAHNRLPNYSKGIQALREQETIDELIHPDYKLFRDFLRYLLKINPKERPGCYEALKHPFFKYKY